MTNESLPQKNPSELLSQQAQALSDLVQVQKAQQEQISALLQQNENIIGWLKAIGQDQRVFRKESRMVKIENINMPFFALVGFLVKVALASIPATLIFVFFLTLIFWGIIALFAALGIFGSIFAAILGSSLH
jgi:hypothetical protein